MASASSSSSTTTTSDASSKSSSLASPNTTAPAPWSRFPGGMAPGTRVMRMEAMSPYSRTVRIGRGDPPSFKIPPPLTRERQQKTDQHEQIPRLVNFFAGGFGGMMGAILTCPLEVVKTRLQARHNKHFVTEGNFRYGLQTVGFLGNIYRKEGIFALWRGIDSHLVGVVPAR
jgi:hypothetical protein